MHFQHSLSVRKNCGWPTFHQIRLQLHGNHQHHLSPWMFFGSFHPSTQVGSDQNLKGAHQGHFECMGAKSFQPCPTLCTPMDCCPPGSSVHGILQAWILEWIAMPSSRESSRPRDRSCISLWHLLHWQEGSLPLAPPGKPLACMQWKPKISAE